jgi:dehydrogenase/reductase SDR family protein 12
MTFSAKQIEAGKDRTMSPAHTVPPVVATTADALLEATVVGSFSRIGYLARRSLSGWQDACRDVLDGQVALVTGASSGLGLAAAHGLARAGARVVLLGRDRARTEEARAGIEERTPGAAVEVLLGDLARLDDMRRAADAIARANDRLDIVVHNAGALVHEHRLTDDGIELTAQTHVVAPFLLNTRLLPLLAGTPGARVIHVVSGGMYTARLSLDALACPGREDFDGVAAYAQAKRASVVLTAEWARRTAGGPAAGISFHAMHPGWADTAGIRASLPRFHRLLRPILRTPEQGADTTVWLATDPAPREVNGRLWLDHRPRRTQYLPRTATPPGEAQRLWEWCVVQAGVLDPTASPGLRPAPARAVR